MCPICEGFGYVTRGVPFGHPDFGKALECDCGLIQKRRIETCDRAGDLAPELRRCTFDNYVLMDGNRAAFTAAQAFSLRPDGWLVILGSPGNGKTHLAAAIYNALHAEDVPVAFVNWPGFLNYLRESFNPATGRGDGYSARFDVVLSAPVLVLDDVGAQRLTEWAEEQLYILLDHRTVNAMPTVITSNCRPEELGHERIVSRLLNTRQGRVVINMAPDYRRAIE